MQSPTSCQSLHSCHPKFSHALLTESPPLCEREVNPYLKKLDTAKLYDLGLELGLNITELKRIPTEQLPLELCMRWLREDDDVHQTSGTPTWSSLATALRNIGASGVASSIEQKMQKLCKSDSIFCYSY